MNNLAMHLSDPGVVQDIGTIILNEEKISIVRCEGNDYRAQRAVSCLVDPIPGDSVLICTASGGESYIMAILKRDGSAAATVSMDGDLSFRLRSGRFSVVASDGMDLVAAEEISLTSPELTVHAAQGSVNVPRLSFVGTLLEAHVERIKLFARSLDAVMERLHQRLKRSCRIVEETDQLRAATIDQQAEKLLNLRGGNSLLTAKELVKLDGEQIHVG